MDVTNPGPDLAIVGAARSGTTNLAAYLSAHPRIDASAVKEPNYFSRHLERGAAWYEDYFQPRAHGLVRMDASVSYTFPQFPEAVAALAAASPSVLVVYAVREPVARAVSHYQYYRHYFGHEQASTFGEALRRDTYYTDVSDYRRWLDVLSSSLPRDQVLVVPFDTITRSTPEVAEVVCARLGIEAPPDATSQAAGHRNNVVTFRSERVRRATRALRHSRAYPTVRRVLGAGTLRRIRSAVTTVPEVQTRDEALASCDGAQRAALDALQGDATAAVEAWLREQDQRLSLDWSAEWPAGQRTP